MKALEDWPALTPEDRSRLGLARRAPKAEVTVALKHKEVLDMWDDENPFGPGDIPATSPVKVRWICPVGHKFIESAVVQCAAVSGWRKKAGGSRACLSCADEQLYGRVTLSCGHEVIARPGVEYMAVCRACRPTARADFAERKAKSSGPYYQAGTVIQSRNLSTSKTEQEVRDKLVAAGFRVHKGRSAIQCGHEPERNNFPVLTPDILISKTKVCVEVDPAYTHAGKEREDKRRNDLLAGVGWQVVRLRLGGLGPIGEHDVLAQSEVVTKHVIEALVLALSDAMAGRPGTIRKVKKKEPVTTRPQSRLGAIAEHKYYYNAFYISWKLNSGAVLRMVAMDSGRYLAISERSEAPRFICMLGLDKVPRQQWRSTVQGILERMSDSDFTPSSTFPWGNDLFIGDHAHAVREAPKFYLGAASFELTANIDGADEYTEVAVCAGGKVLTQLHPKAVERGWRIGTVRTRTVRNDTYQEIQLLRRPLLVDAEVGISEELQSH
ncbi:hypothetical protein QFZ36_004181 [Pseudarthrobacter siccitolerans]|uniref:DUF559 domain-containing protein n=1 Tax=Pseudarthrobacter siccitolerans TaxID=861266 RepID=A0ABU0PRH3_9MICC|nr:DUF559 domain-containing protein [Pseudarthrobacter siccitolerans]MDQ0676555.1 hypothetical protein [Pseudarthrobacter siccitolerans]